MIAASSLLLALGAGVIQEGDLEVNFGQSATVAGISKPVAVALDRTGESMAAIGSDGVLTLYAVADQKPKGSAPGVPKGEACLAFSPNGQLLASWGSDGAIKAWSLEPLQARDVATKAGKPGPIAFSGDASLIAAGAQNGTVTVYGTKDGKSLQEFKAHKGKVLALAFEPSGRTVVSLGEDERMRFWDVQTGEAAGGELSFPDRQNFKTDFRSAAATPDGSMFVVGCRVLANRGAYSDIVEYDQLRVYDRTGRRIVLLDARLASLSDRVAISPDGRVVASTGKDGKLLVWDAEAARTPIEIKGVGKCAAMTLRQGERSWILAAAGDAAGFWKIGSPRPPAPQQKAAPPAAEFSIEFVNPQEAWPFTEKPTTQIVVEAKGAASDLKWSVRLLGDQPRDLRVVPADPILRTGPRIAETLNLNKGPNVIEVTATDGAHTAKLTKTVTVVTRGQTGFDGLYANAHALVIGINAYTKVRALDFAVNDADAVARTLVEKHGFPSQNVRVLKDAEATKTRIEQELFALADPSRVKQGDRVVVFYAGHGQGVAAAEGPMGYIIPVDFPAPPDDPNNHSLFLSKGFSMSQVRDIARAIPAKHVLFLMDCCFSGVAAESRVAHPGKAFDVALASQCDSRAVITAGSDRQLAWEMRDLRHGAFTKHVLDALSGRMADKDGDGLVTTSELYAYVRESLAEKNPQDRPQTAQFGRFTSSAGEMLFRVPG